MTITPPGWYGRLLVKLTSKGCFGQSRLVARVKFSPLRQLTNFFNFQKMFYFC
jgi:hypothetical protein